MGRKQDPDIARPSCPRGHEGKVWIHGSLLSGGGRFEKTRYYCVPDDRGEKKHAFTVPLALRREIRAAGHECENCERVFRRAEGFAAGWRYAFSVRDAAEALVRAGVGGYDNSYRKIGRTLRAAAGRKSARGMFKGSVPRGAQLASDYLDAFAGLVNSAVAPTSWPPILLLDDKPVFRPDHSACCQPYRDRGEKPPRHDSWGPPDDDASAVIDVLGPAVEGTATLDEEAELFGGAAPVTPQVANTPEVAKRVLRPKVSHDAPVVEVGRILVAVGQETPGGVARPWLVRFAGGRDEVSWTEFLESLPGQPEWVVSDRDQAIHNAVRTVFRGTTHYACEQHIAANAAKVARDKDDIGKKAMVLGIPETRHPFWAALEAAQWSEDRWIEAIEAAREWGLPETARWLTDTMPLAQDQWAKRRTGYPRSAGACESVIVAVWAAISGRISCFRNADRMNLLLGLVRSNIDQKASVPAYSKILRAAFASAEGRANPEWDALRDPAGSSSMVILFADAQERAKAAKSRRAAPGKAGHYRKRRAAYEQERTVLGLLPSPRGRPRVVRAQGSVAGKTVADFPRLVAQWHETNNGGLIPSDVPAGSGMMIWWRCPNAPDHEWACQVRSRTLRGSGCRFCAHKAIARSECLTTTHPDVAASWHPTRNGTKTPADFTYGSHYEAWWQCGRFKGHVWRARISSRTSQVAGCSLCVGRNVRADAIDLRTRSA